MGEVWRTFRRAFLSLAAPVAVLASIVLGVCTPTEAAAVAAAVTMILGFFVYRNMKLSDLWPICLRSGIMSGGIMLIVAMANILGWTLALDRVPQQIAQAMLSLSVNPLAVLLMINLLLLVVGMFMETIAAVIILVPVFMPIVAQLGINPVHFGLVVCLNLTIGMLTPPVGVLLYTAAMACEVPAQRVLKPIWSWVAVCFAVLAFVTYFPGATMFVPRLFFGR